MSKEDVSFQALNFNRAIIGGLTSAALIFLGTFWVGTIGNWEALAIIKEICPALRFTCSAIVTATATILALILTLVSFSSSTEKPLAAQHYARIQWIARFCIFAFISSLLLLFVLNLPLENVSDEIKHWFKYIYYGIVIYDAVLGGVMVALILMLYQAAKELIIIVHPEKDAGFLFSVEEEKNNT